MKRNNYILSLLLLVVSAFNLAPAYAQQNQYAIYNYRNDGDFNAWLNIDIDSITYSCIDTLGVEHDDVVVQEVWTPDSVYRIPINAIDSLGFRAPKPEYRDNVFHITEEHLPYIIAVDDYSITFSTSLPQSLRPQVGQTIVSDTFEKPLEDGFAGKVEQINTNGNELVFLCGQASIIDVFKKFVLVGKAVSENPANISKAAPRKGWFDDPWITVEEQGIKQIDIPTDLELEILGGVFGVKSKDPQLTLGYYFYLDDVIYSFSADAYLNHKDLSFTTAFKLSDFMKVAESGSEYLTNFILGKGDEKEAEEKWYEHEFDDLKFKIPFHVGPVNFSIELAPVFKLKGDVELDVIQKTSARQHIGFRKSGYTAALVANPFISLLLGDMSYNYVQDPMRSQQLTAKMKGSATMGLSLQLKVNLISKNVAHAAIGAEYDRKLSGNLQFNLYDTEQQPSSFYDVIKDSKIKVEDYVKIKGEIGVSPLKFLSLSGSFEIPVKEWGEYHLVPHFTKPELPTYSMGRWTYKNPMSLYSTVSKDILLECKPGLKIVDTEGNLVKEYTSTEPYQYEVAWSLTPLEMNLEQLTPNTTYKCYPTFSMLGLKPFTASPSYEFTVPYPVSFETDNLYLQIGKSQRVAINGGWGDYSLGHLNKTACDAELKKEGDNYYIQLLGKAKGLAPITVNDLRSGESTTIIVDVVEEVTNLALSETSVSMKPNETEDVMITSGSGSYSLENSNEEVAVATISNGNKVAIAALKAGTATITVTDTKTQQTATIAVAVTDNGQPNIGEKVVMERKYKVHHGGNYHEPQIILDFGNKQVLHVGYLKMNWWGDYSHTKHGIHIIAGDDWGKADEENEWYIAPTIADEWVTEKLIVSLDGKVQYYMNGQYMGEKTFTGIDLSNAKTVSIQARPFGWWTGHSHYMDDFRLTTPFTSISDDFNDGALDTNIWLTPVNPDGVREEDGILKMEMLRTDQDFDLRSKPIPLFEKLENLIKVVDLGLPSGTMWASCNVGAYFPEDRGSYFAWGETEPKSNYNSWETYKWGNPPTKYNNEDGKLELDPEDDAAYANWGNEWRMPSYEQLDELKELCQWEWTTLNGVNGFNVVGLNGNSIFIPAGDSSSGWLWSRTRLSDVTDSAYNLDLISGGVYWDNDNCHNRYHGHMVRPVRMK